MDTECVDAFDTVEDDLGSCENGSDDDGDGWSDGDDPDCATSTEESLDGTLYGTECNDGEDNDADGFVDAEDPNCVEGMDDIEAAQSCENGDPPIVAGDPTLTGLI